MLKAEHRIIVAAIIAEEHIKNLVGARQQRKPTFAQICFFPFPQSPN